MSTVLFSPILIPLSPALSTRIFFKSTFPPEISIPSLPIFEKYKSSSIPSEKSVSIASDFVSIKRESEILNSDLITLIESSELFEIKLLLEICTSLIHRN